MGVVAWCPVRMSLRESLCVLLWSSNPDICQLFIMKVTALSKFDQTQNGSRSPERENQDQCVSQTKASRNAIVLKIEDFMRFCMGDRLDGPGLSVHYTNLIEIAYDSKNWYTS